MAELVVAPRIEIGSVILVKTIEIAEMLRLMTTVQHKLSFVVNLRPRTSSIESLMGKTQNGTAKVTTTIMPKREI